MKSGIVYLLFLVVPVVGFSSDECRLALEYIAHIEGSSSDFKDLSVLTIPFSIHGSNVIYNQARPFAVVNQTVRGTSVPPEAMTDGLSDHDSAVQGHKKLQQWAASLGTRVPNESENYRLSYKNLRELTVQLILRFQEIKERNHGRNVVFLTSSDRSSSGVRAIQWISAREDMAFEADLGPPPTVHNEGAEEVSHDILFWGNEQQKIIALFRVRNPVTGNLESQHLRLETDYIRFSDSDQNAWWVVPNSRPSSALHWLIPHSAVKYKRIEIQLGVYPENALDYAITVEHSPINTADYTFLGREDRNTRVLNVNILNNEGQANFVGLALIEHRTFFPAQGNRYGAIASHDNSILQLELFPELMIRAGATQEIITNFGTGLMSALPEYTQTSHPTYTHTNQIYEK